MNRVLIVGASSAIAEATARCFAAEGAALFLLGRRRERLQAIADDLRIRGAVQAGVAELDVADLAAQGPALEQASAALGGIDVALIAHGTLPDQDQCERDVALALREFHVNGVATLALMQRIANHMAAQGSGVLAVISSVAGDRGRQSNYLYGSAKSAVSTYAAGLRNRLHPKGVHVLTIKPGFVDTPMTAQFKKGALWATPADVGSRIHQAIRRRRDVLYVPGFWRLIMRVIRSIPEFVFKRLRL